MEELLALLPLQESLGLQSLCHCSKKLLGGLPASLENCHHFHEGFKAATWGAVKLLPLLCVEGGAGGLTAWRCAATIIAVREEVGKRATTPPLLCKGEVDGQLEDLLSLRGEKQLGK